MAKRADWLAVNNASALVADLLAHGKAEVRSTPKRALVIYPFADLMERRSGASRRCAMLLDYLAASGLQVDALQAGGRVEQVNDKILVRGMGHASGLSRLLYCVFTAAMYVAPRAWRPHGWQIWEYWRLRLDRPMQRRIAQLVARSDVVLLEYPFLAAAVVPIARRLGRRVVLTTYDVLANQLTSTPRLHRIMWATEQRALRLADDVVSVASDDQALLAKHGIAALVSPNPTDAQLFSGGALPAPREVVTRLYDIDLPGDDILLFVGSRHGPNVIAVDRLREIAASLDRQPGGRRVGVVVVGRCAEPEQAGNFLALGVVDDALLLALYGLAFAAVIPLPSGTGASLKTVEAMASGVLVIGTPIAFRGLDVENGQQCVIEPDINRYCDLIRELLQDADRAKAIAAAGLSFARRYHYVRCYSVYNRFLGLDAAYSPLPATGALDPILLHLANLALQRGLPGLGREFLDRVTDQAAATALLSAPVRDEPLGHDPAPKLVQKDALWQWFHAGRYADIVTIVE
jgi:glycosyltransferase involved in cell wall biosynthesis